MSGLLKVLKFVAWAGKQAAKWGAKKAAAVANWARNNWRTVLKWLERGLSYSVIFEMILRELGYL